MPNDLEIKNQDEVTGESSLKRSILRATIGLALYAIITAGLIAVTQVSTKEQIAEQVKIARSKALLQVMPADHHDNDLLQDSFWLPADSKLGLKQPAEAFIARRNGQAIAVVLPSVAAEGYSGPIQLIIGVADNGSLLGVRILDHKETPGLGDNADIKKSDWLLQFDGKSLANPKSEQWKVKKDGGDFDQLTGATITPRAIVKQVRATLEFYLAHRSQLLSGTEQPNSEDKPLTLSAKPPQS